MDEGTRRPSGLRETSGLRRARRLSWRAPERRVGAWDRRAVLQWNPAPAGADRRRQSLHLRQRARHRSRKKWKFEPRVKVGDTVEAGDVLGVVQEVEHRILVPVGMKGDRKSVSGGDHTVLDGDGVALGSCAGPSASLGPCQHLAPVPMTTSARRGHVLPGGPRQDRLRPLRLREKTVIQHQFAKWAQAQIVVSSAAASASNETDGHVLTRVPGAGPQTGAAPDEAHDAHRQHLNARGRPRSLRLRPSPSRSRDRYSVALMADTSRWAGGVREMSGRLEEMPGEEECPRSCVSYSFYERAGAPSSWAGGGREGSITVIGGRLPSRHGDTLRKTVTRTRASRGVRGLTSVAHRRRFPAPSTG